MQLCITSGFSVPWNSHGEYIHVLLWCEHHVRFIGDNGFIWQ